MSRDLRRSRLRSHAAEGAGPFKPVAIPAVKAAVSIGKHSQTVPDPLHEHAGRTEESVVARKKPLRRATPRASK
jgi:hypothetical protein